MGWGFPSRYTSHISKLLNIPSATIPARAHSPPQSPAPNRSHACSRRRGFSAGSFRDMTRVARLDEDMWTELFLNDADYLSKELDVLIANLTEFADALKAGDPDTLRALLKDGREKKATAGGN